MIDAPYITKKDATTVKNMRKACHDIMYTIVNSREYSKDNKQGNMLPWQKTVVTFDVIAGIVVVALEVLAAYIYRRRFTK
ncbi:beta-glucosidase [Ligilactobacillus sp. WC1T17]|uniref:Beta-glucosidase n=1 Tax=Ligilactobacillus ruminis TaxID=1623 RepID=A0ABY1AC42_9LACO|nr:beta-glucosidase [Ligilactobacillus ruminis]